MACLRFGAGHKDSPCAHNPVREKRKRGACTRQRQRHSKRHSSTLHTTHYSGARFCQSAMRNGVGAGQGKIFETCPTTATYKTYVGVSACRTFRAVIQNGWFGQSENFNGLIGNTASEQFRAVSSRVGSARFLEDGRVRHEWTTKRGDARGDAPFQSDERFGTQSA